MAADNEARINLDFDDIRVYLSIKTNRKFLRFRRIVGIGAMHYLIMLWREVAIYNPTTGYLGTNWDKFDLADICEYQGDPDELFDALESCHFIEHDSDSDHYRIRNWPIRQPHIIQKPYRILKAKMASAKRWGDLSTYATIYKQLFGVKPPDLINKESDATSKPISNPLGNAPYPTPYTNIVRKDCSNCGKIFNPKHHTHTKCLDCYKDPSNTTRYNFPTCPYCSRAQAGLRISHQHFGCNLCKPDEVE